jgi:Ca2+-binding RTX toxin-like protein
MTGGTGADAFIFTAIAPGETDTITDFSRAESDLIKLKTIDADVSTDANEAFDFIGYADFTGEAGELRAVNHGGSQLIEGDVDGDGLADISIVALGSTLVEADWFVL